MGNQAFIDFKPMTNMVQGKWYQFSVKNNFDRFKVHRCPGNLYFKLYPTGAVHGPFTAGEGMTFVGAEVQQAGKYEVMADFNGNAIVFFSAGGSSLDGEPVSAGLPTVNGPVPVGATLPTPAFPLITGLVGADSGTVLPLQAEDPMSQFVLHWNASTAPTQLPFLVTVNPGTLRINNPTVSARSLNVSVKGLTGNGYVILQARVTNQTADPTETLVIRDATGTITRTDGIIQADGIYQVDVDRYSYFDIDATNLTLATPFHFTLSYQNPLTSVGLRSQTQEVGPGNPLPVTQIESYQASGTAGTPGVFVQNNSLHIPFKDYSVQAQPLGGTLISTYSIDVEVSLDGTNFTTLFTITEADLGKVVSHLGVPATNVRMNMTEVTLLGGDGAIQGILICKP